jgi:hypothetical protein
MVTNMHAITLQPVAKSAWVPNRLANAGDALPVTRNPHALTYGFPTKLVPIYTAGVQTGWDEVHVNSKLTEVRHQPIATTALSLDPIMRDMERDRARSQFKPVWMGD